MEPNDLNTFSATSHKIDNIWRAYVAANQARVPFFEWMGEIYFVQPVTEVANYHHFPFCRTGWKAEAQ